MAGRANIGELTMTMKCATCCHPKRLQIDRRIVQGGNVAEIAREYGLSYNSVWAHSRDHVSHQLVAATRKKELMESMNIISDVETLISRTQNILDTVEGKQQFGQALAAVRELRGCYELLSKIAFALHQARLAELEQEQLSREYDNHLEKQHIGQRLQKLSTDQLKTLQQISFEVFRESWENYGIEPLDEYKPMRRTKPPKRKPEPEPEPEPEPTTLDPAEHFAKKPVRVFRALK